MSYIKKIQFKVDWSLLIGLTAVLLTFESILLNVAVILDEFP